MSDNILLSNFKEYDKLEVHRQGLQHFAFSVFLFTKEKEILLQRRSIEKYHSPRLWSNTCCSHFCNISEFHNKEKKIRKRLNDELCLDYNGLLSEITTFSYKENVGDLIENEISYIFAGFLDKASVTSKINKYEVEEIKFVDFDIVRDDVINMPNVYTRWFKLIIEDSDLFNKLRLFCYSNR